MNVVVLCSFESSMVIATLGVGYWVVAVAFNVRSLVILAGFRVRSRIMVGELGVWVGIILDGRGIMFFDVRSLMMVLAFIIGSCGMRVVLGVRSVMCLMACIVRS
jgi:hypothetical protein